MQTRVLTTSLLLATALAAQATPFTSPAGLLTTDGSSNHDYILFKYNKLRWQQLDETSVGQTATVVTKIAWRRDAVLATNAAYAARSIDLTLILSDAVKPVAVSPEFDNNYAGTPTTVFTTKTVNLPDWTQKPAASPANFDFVVTLDTPWPYLGQKPFLWEVRADNNTAAGTNYGNDFHSVTGSTATSNSGVALGTGCVATGQTSAMLLSASLWNHVIRFRMSAGVSRAPATTPVVLFIDAANASLPIPGLCGTLYALPTVQLPLGISSSTGTVSTIQIDNIPYAQSAIGQKLYSQAVALDAGQANLPVVVSNGRENTFPADPATFAPVTRIYQYQVSPTSALTTPTPWTGGIVTKFE
ncbi:MAG: hypothetical protein IT458_11130 [Planctomycetes bacterium]|nr:hypothetical protein [Planctomycetota bacterium]